jgi:hypothetical protein
VPLGRRTRGGQGDLLDRPSAEAMGAASEKMGLEHRKAIQQGILKYFARNERLDAYRETGERQSTRSTG